MKKEDLISFELFREIFLMGVEAAEDTPAGTVYSHENDVEQDCKWIWDEWRSERDEGE